MPESRRTPGGPRGEQSPSQALYRVGFFDPIGFRPPKCLFGVLKSFEIVIFRGNNTLGRKVRVNLAEIVLVGWGQEMIISNFSTKFGFNF